MKIIVIFGAPGAGKGTQAKKIAEKFNFTHISTGDMLRNEVANKTELGLKAKKYMNKGELVPDNVIIAMVEKTISELKNSQGIIFDGFPRTLTQAQNLDSMLNNNKLKISNVLYLDVPENTLINRLKKRAEIENRKDDAQISVVENRIKVYNKKTAPIIEYYNKNNKVTKINGVGEINSIFDRISNKINFEN